MEQADRRSKTRLTLPECVVFGPRGSTGRVLDVSAEGVRVEIDSKCLFARGEQHRLVLSNVLEFVEVEGMVRWTNSKWSGDTGSADSKYRQTAGLTLARLLTPDPKGLWSSLLAGIPVAPKPLPSTALPAAEPFPVGDSNDELGSSVGASIEASIGVPIETPPDPVVPTDRESADSHELEAPVAKPRRPKPPVELLDPAPGAHLGEPTAQVTCRILEPDVVCAVFINRAEAEIADEMARATVHLDRGLNRIKAVIRRCDGSYSTYLLGKIERLG